MTRIICVVILILLALILFCLFGRNKRQLKKIPPGMLMCCNNPVTRYIIYALGVFILVFVGGCVLLCYYAGGFEEAGSMMYVCIGLAVLNFFICLILGQVMAASHIFFDNERVIVGRAFRAPLVFNWYELGEMEFVNQTEFRLYDRNGRHTIRVFANMINYEKFAETALGHLGGCSYREI